MFTVTEGLAAHSTDIQSHHELCPAAVCAQWRHTCGALQSQRVSIGNNTCPTQTWQTEVLVELLFVWKVTLKYLHNVTDGEFVALKVEARVTDFSR